MDFRYFLTIVRFFCWSQETELNLKDFDLNKIIKGGFFSEYIFVTVIHGFAQWV